MKKLIRASYPVEINVIILLSLYFFAVVFSYEMFDVRFHNPEHLENSYPGMALFGVAVVLAIMIVWEELLEVIEKNSEYSLCFLPAVHSSFILSILNMI